LRSAFDEGGLFQKHSGHLRRANRRRFLRHPLLRSSFFSAPQLRAFSLSPCIWPGAELQVSLPVLLFIQSQKKIYSLLFKRQRLFWRRRLGNVILRSRKP